MNGSRTLANFNRRSSAESASYHVKSNQRLKKNSAKNRIERFMPYVSLYITGPGTKIALAGEPA